MRGKRGQRIKLNMANVYLKIGSFFIVVLEKMAIKTIHRIKQLKSLNTGGNRQIGQLAQMVK